MVVTLRPALSKSPFIEVMAPITPIEPVMVPLSATIQFAGQAM